MKKIFLITTLILAMMLSLVACKDRNKPDDDLESGDSQIQQDQVQQEDKGVSGSDFNDLEFLPQPEDTDKDNTTDTQKPEQDKTPVEDETDDASSEEPDDKDTEQEKDDTSKTDDTTPPSTDSGNSGSGSGSGGSSDGSTGTTIVNGEELRQFPAGTDVNTITPDPSKFFERVMIGNDEYLWNGSIWGLVDNTDPPNQDSVVNGDPFSGSQSMH